jgi:GTP-binding protein HflX
MQLAVNQVLAELGAADTPQLLVFNKLDQCPGAVARIERDLDGLPSAVWLSAHTGEGLNLLRQALAERLAPTAIALCLYLPYTYGELRAQAHRHGWLRAEDTDANGWRLTLELPPKIWENWACQLAYNNTKDA